MLLSPRNLVNVVTLILCVVSINVNAHHPKHTSSSTRIQGDAKGVNPNTSRIQHVIPPIGVLMTSGSSRQKRHGSSVHQPLLPGRGHGGSSSSSGREPTLEVTECHNSSPSKETHGDAGSLRPEFEHIDGQRSLVPQRCKSSSGSDSRRPEPNQSRSPRLSPTIATSSGSGTSGQHSKQGFTAPTKTQGPLPTDVSHNRGYPDSCEQHSYFPLKPCPTPMDHEVSSSSGPRKRPGFIPSTTDANTPWLPDVSHKDDHSEPSIIRPVPMHQPSPRNPTLGGESSKVHHPPEPIPPPQVTQLSRSNGTHAAVGSNSTLYPDPYPYQHAGSDATSPPRQTQQPLPPNLVKENDPQALMRRIAGTLHRGLPGGWEHLFQAPETNGSTGIEVIHPADLNDTLQTWSLDEKILERVFRDINILIHTAIGDGIYVARGLAYTSPTCHNTQGPLCLSTLIVSARVQYARDHRAWRAEIAHIYMRSTAERAERLSRPFDHSNITVNDLVSRFKDQSQEQAERFRQLTRQELQTAESLLSTYQSNWALDHIPLQDVLSTTHHGDSLTSSGNLRDTGSFENLLGLFIGNMGDNRMEFNIQKDGLLRAIQDATLKREQTMNNRQQDVEEEDLTDILKGSLSTCFKQAGIQATFHEWWQRTYPDLRGRPISIECESAIQRFGSTELPTEECSTASNVTIITAYSWAVIVPYGRSLKVMLLENNLNTTVVDCKESLAPSVKIKNGDPVGDPLGAVVRWSVIQPNGSFHPVQYLAHWSMYRRRVSRLILDVLRLQTASAFMNVPLPQVDLSQNPIQPMDPPESIADDDDQHVSREERGSKMSSREKS